MGMQPHLFIPGKHCALPQQIAGDGEGRTGGQGHLTHGTEAVVVIEIDQPFAVRQYLVHSLHHRIRRQSAVLYRQVHAAPGGMEAHAQAFRGPELGGYKVSSVLGKDVMVVEAGGAAVLHQLCHAYLGAEQHHILIQVFPDLIQGLQPVEQLHVLDLRQIAGEYLVKMMMGVDQTGETEHAGGVDLFIHRVIHISADGTDYAVPYIDGGVTPKHVALVTGNDGVRVLYQQGAHSFSSSANKAARDSVKGGRQMPFSVMMPASRLWSVTSKAGLKHLTPAGAIGSQ